MKAAPTLSVDEKKVEMFVGQVIGDLSAGMSCVMINIGHELGLFRTMHMSGPMTLPEISYKSGLYERYVEEWLKSMVAGAYIMYNSENETFELPLENGLVLAEEDSPVFLSPGFQVISSLWYDKDKLVKAFKTGNGIPWGAHHHNLFFGTEAFYRAGYRSQLVNSWIPSLNGIEDKLKAGGKIADIGCGHGASSIIMAEAYPNSVVYGFDYHEESIRIAEERAASKGLTNIHFRVAKASDFPGNNYDLICFMDAFHDLGHPDRAAKHALKTLCRNGSLMLVEPLAGDNLNDNINSIGRMYYAASTALCVPHAHSECGSYCLGAQAGPKRLMAILESAGYTDVRECTKTPVNLILEAKIN